MMKTIWMMNSKFCTTRLSKILTKPFFSRSVWFMKSCSLSWLPSGANKWVDAGFGDIQLHYDQEVCASRILFSDSTGLVVSNSFATPNTNLNVNK